MKIRGIPALRVEVSGTLVGHLQRDRGGAMQLTPDPGWLDGGQHPRLGYAQLTQPGPRRSPAGVPHWFEHLLPPEHSPLRRRIAQEQDIHKLGSPRLLLLLGGDLPGAVTVRGEVEDGDEEAPAQEVDAGAPGLVRFSLAGMQLKLSLVQDGERYALPAAGRSGAWIVKLPGAAFPDMVEVEAATLSWAGAAGLTVPETRIVAVEQLAVEGLPQAFGAALAVRRFDRPDSGGRIHQEDFAQALDVHPEYIYSEGGDRRVSYDGLGRLVLAAAGPAEQARYVEHLAFVVAAGDGDAHLKNWSFQWGHLGMARLSPAYDRVSTISWPEHHGWRLSGGARLALGLGRTRRFAHLDRAALKTFAARAQTSDGEARFMAALERAKDAWPSIAPIAPPRMRDALREHWANVPLLREIGGLGG